MAHEIPVLRHSLDAAATVADQFVGVIVDASGLAALPAANGPIIGVTQEKMEAGRAVGIETHGITKMLAVSAVTAGDAIAVDAAGKAKTAAAGNVIVGRCLVGAGAGGLATVLLLGGAAVA